MAPADRAMGPPALSVLLRCRWQRCRTGSSAMTPRGGCWARICWPRCATAATVGAALSAPSSGISYCCRSTSAHHDEPHAQLLESVAGAMSANDLHHLSVFMSSRLADWCATASTPPNLTIALPPAHDYHLPEAVQASRHAPRCLQAMRAAGGRRLRGAAAAQGPGGGAPPGGGRRARHRARGGGRGGGAGAAAGAP